MGEMPYGTSSDGSTSKRATQRLHFVFNICACQNDVHQRITVQESNLAPLPQQSRQQTREHPEVEPVVEWTPVRQQLLPAMDYEEEGEELGRKGREDEPSNPPKANNWGAAAAGVLHAPVELPPGPKSP